MNSTAITRLECAVKYLRETLRETSSESVETIQQIVDLITTAEELIARTEFRFDLEQLDMDPYSEYNSNADNNLIFSGLNSSDTISLG
jgi:hypothetical protein